MAGHVDQSFATDGQAAKVSTVRLLLCQVCVGAAVGACVGAAIGACVHPNSYSL